MAEYVPTNELLGSWSRSIEDPLEDKTLKCIRGLVLNDIVSKDEEPMTCLDKLVSQLRTKGVRQMVSLFPELKFNALKVVEYELHYVILTLSSPMDFWLLPDDYVLNFTPYMDGLKSMLSDLEEILKSDALLDEEQALRVDAHCKTLADAHKDHISAYCQGDSESWQPFFSENFSTEDEKVFMTSLRKLCVRSPKMDANEALRTLLEICQSADMDTVLSSDSLTHNAMRMVIKTVINVINKPGSKFLSIQQKDLLIQKFSQLNSPSYLHSSPSFAMRNLARRRIGIFRAIIEREDFIEMTSRRVPELLDEKTLGSPSSALWQKLSAPASATKYSDPNIFKHCAICASEDVSRKNFGILDVCDHLYCADCISRSIFEFQNSTCPYCRQDIKEFTTRDLFLSKVKDLSTSESD